MKLCTRVKRKKDLTTSFSHKRGVRTTKTKRPKTYRTVEKANEYAKLKGIKSFSVEQKGKKFVVVKT